MRWKHAKHTGVYWSRRVHSPRSGQPQSPPCPTEPSPRLAPVAPVEPVPRSPHVLSHHHRPPLGGYSGTVVESTAATRSRADRSSP